MLILPMTCKTGRDNIDRDVIFYPLVSGRGQVKNSDLLTLYQISSVSVALRPKITLCLMLIHRHTCKNTFPVRNSSQFCYFVYKSEFLLSQTKPLLLFSFASPRAAVVL